jgi:hypothetical protein
LRRISFSTRNSPTSRRSRRRSSNSDGLTDNEFAALASSARMISNPGAQRRHIHTQPARNRGPRILRCPTPSTPASCRNCSGTSTDASSGTPSSACQPESGAHQRWSRTDIGAAHMNDPVRAVTLKLRRFAFRSVVARIGWCWPQACLVISGVWRPRRIGRGSSLRRRRRASLPNPRRAGRGGGG